MKPRHTGVIKTDPQSRQVDRQEAIEIIYQKCDVALAKSDTDALLSFYASDAVLESPLVPHLLGTNTGICQGHEELRRLFEILARRKPKVRQHYRTGYLRGRSSTTAKPPFKLASSATGVIHHRAKSEVTN